MFFKLFVVFLIILSNIRHKIVLIIAKPTVNQWELMVIFDFLIYSISNIFNSTTIVFQFEFE